MEGILMKDKIDRKKAMAFKKEMIRIYEAEQKKLDKKMFNYVKRRSGGLLAAQKPACFGSGNSMKWCPYCGLKYVC